MPRASLSIYIHWPFCKIKCPYCDFNSYKRDSVDQTQWMEAYLRALELWFSRLDQRIVGSIFFGGGTPSLLDPKSVELSLQKINKLWGINNDCEISIEANPNSVSELKFKRFKFVHFITYSQYFFWLTQLF